MHAPIRNCARAFSAILTLSLLILALASRSATAQENTANLNGIVKDASGAVIPGAAIKLTNLGTNVAQTKDSNSDGLYSFVSITPGHYSLEIHAQGFQTEVQPGFTLEVNQTATVNFTMQIGSTKEVISVTGEKYHPELFYFDFWVGQPEVRPYLARFAALFYNQASGRRSLGVINYKLDTMHPKSAVLDVERGVFSGIRPEYWQTDTRLRCCLAVTSYVTQKSSSLARNRHNLPTFSPRSWPLRAMRNNIAWFAPKSLVTSLTLNRGSNIVWHGLAFI